MMRAAAHVIATLNGMEGVGRGGVEERKPERLWARMATAHWLLLLLLMLMMMMLRLRCRMQQGEC